jgi:hypothetical protein
MCRIEWIAVASAWAFGLTVFRELQEFAANFGRIGDWRVSPLY